MPYVDTTINILIRRRAHKRIALEDPTTKVGDKEALEKEIESLAVRISSLRRERLKQLRWGSPPKEGIK